MKKYVASLSLKDFTYSDPTNLRGKRILAVKDSSASELLKSVPEVTIVDARNYSDGLKMLEFGRGDLYILHETPFKNLFATGSSFDRSLFHLSSNLFSRIASVIALSFRWGALAEPVSLALKSLKLRVNTLGSWE